MTQRCFGRLAPCSFVLGAAFLSGSRMMAVGQVGRKSARTESAVDLREVKPPVDQRGASTLTFEAILPNGRRLTPVGAWVPTAPYPFSLAMRPDGAQIVMPAVGWPFSLNVLDVATGQRRLFRLIAKRQMPAGSKNSADIETMNGVAYSADGSRLYVSTGDSGAVDVYSTNDWHRTARWPMDGEAGGSTYGQSFSGAMVLSPDGRRLYAIDQGNWRVVVYDTVSGTRVASLRTGVNPFALTLAPDGGRLYVANSGMFEYRRVEGVEDRNLVVTGLKFPPFGYPSREAREGVMAEGHAVPGLGPENADRGSSVWTYDVGAGHAPELTARVHVGAMIDAEGAGKGPVGGSAPMGIVAGAEEVYVSLAHEDAVAVLRADGTRQIAAIALSPFEGERFEDGHGRPLRGVMPAGMALHEGRLYVTEAGINAIGVVDTATRRVLGHVPVGWFPSAVAVSRDGHSLYAVNTKGRGAGPNGGKAFEAQNTGSYIGEREFGSLSVVPLGDETNLRGMTEQVKANNVAALEGSSVLPKLRHVFLVIRENRTFDEILGDLRGADGDPALARWGMHGWTKTAPRDRTLQVTPNAHALAERFATSDLFFVDSDVSADGHRWIVGAAETPWFHVAWTSNYGGRRTGDTQSKAPGRRAMGGGSDAPMPEDEPQFGTLWEHVANGGLSIRNYGEGLEVEGSEEIPGAEPEGQRLVLNAPVPLPVFQSSDRAFPTFNLGIPDQVRYEEFERDFGQVLERGDAPSLVVIRLPGDHTAKPRPADGYPDAASYVADNDLALGRIVEFISHSKIWKDSAVLVAEDDAQGGVDHVDAHRSVMLAISPWVRPGYVSHRDSSMGSLQKTAYALLGLGALNLEDALAADLGDMFAATPDLRPFTAVAADPRVFDPAKARVARPKSAEEARELRDMDDPAEIAAEHAVGRRRAASR